MSEQPVDNQSFMVPVEYLEVEDEQRKKRDRQIKAMLNELEKTKTDREMRRTLFALGYDPRQRRHEKMYMRWYGYPLDQSFSDYVWTAYPKP